MEKNGEGGQSRLQTTVGGYTQHGKHRFYMDLDYLVCVRKSLCFFSHLDLWSSYSVA